MRNTTELLARYAGYHRDRRHIATHFAGLPMIVFVQRVGPMLIRARSRQTQA